MLALDRAIAEEPFSGYIEAIPSYRSLLIFFEPDETTLAGVVDHVRARLGGLALSTPPDSAPKEVPAVYDGDDLEEVARLSKLTREEVIALHSEREYLVFVVGFTPGFAYMGMTDDKLALPRRDSPRTRVRRGSVAIAMGQTGVYPSDTPGGWHLLGRADPDVLFDVDRDPPSRFVPGDRVKFVPVNELPETSSARRRSTPKRLTGQTVLEVVEPGLLTTVQDLGRPGYQRYGVPVAGAADAVALRAANALVGNPAGAAALECTVQGPTLRFSSATLVAVAGADLGALVRRADLGEWRPPPWSSFLMRPGNVLSFEGRRDGARAYISLGGGVDVEPVLGSRSTYLTAGLGGLDGRPLRAGDELAVCARDGVPTFGRAGQRLQRPRLAAPSVVRIVWGPQDDYFTEDARRTLVSEEYRVGSDADRMGCRLDGAVLEHSDAKEIISDGNALGSIQVPPNGLPIVMLADRATTGGYPKIATVVSSDIWRLAQLVPGDALRFEVSSPSNP